MKIKLFIICIGLSLNMYAQEIPSSTQEQLEILADAGLAEDIDPEQLQQEKISVNKVGANELGRLNILSPLQIESFLNYRRQFGAFISIYELQAIPNWDIALIKRLFPLLILENEQNVLKDFKQRLKGGQHQIILRASQLLSNETNDKYKGRMQHLYMRYKYSYKNLLQFGWVGDKDAGEQFFRGAQRYGFDFYSFHLYIKQIGIFQTLALGDFTINFGQGLIHWQSLAFKKSGDPMMIKRESATLRPYSSAGEYNFHRGAAFIIQRKNISVTAFTSIRRLSATISLDANGEPLYFSAFRTSGYHRNETELKYRNNLQQLVSGMNVMYQRQQWHTGLNFVYDHFSAPLQKPTEAYQLYAISGRQWMNASVDYHYNIRNVHWFGELAIDQQRNFAWVHGALISLDRKIDVSILYRNISSRYHSLTGNAFTENTSPSNETGVYLGVRLRLSNECRLDLYRDSYHFPWLKYQVDAPTSGSDYLIQLTYTPSKQVELTTRYRDGKRIVNGLSFTDMVNTERRDLRLHAKMSITNSFSWSTRFEYSWWRRDNESVQPGFLVYTECSFEKRLSVRLRGQIFEVRGYNSRIYAYESDLSSSVSLPAFNGEGIYYYIVLQYRLKKNTRVGARWSQGFASENASEPAASKKEIKLQIQHIF